MWGILALRCSPKSEPRPHYRKTSPRFTNTRFEIDSFGWSVPFSRLDIAIAQFPWLGRLIGDGTHRKRFSPDGNISPLAAALLCKVAALPSSVVRSTTAGLQSILKAKAFLANTTIQVQILGLAMMLQTFRRMVAVQAELPGGDDCVVLGVSHTWDETKQLLREWRSSNPYLRAPTQKIARTVVVQQSMVHAMAVRTDLGGQQHVHHRAETYLIPALQIDGKTTAHLTAALRSGPLPVHIKERMHQVASCVSALVLTPFFDAASTGGVCVCVRGTSGLATSCSIHQSGATCISSTALRRGCSRGTPSSPSCIASCG